MKTPEEIIREGEEIVAKVEAEEPEAVGESEEEESEDNAEADEPRPVASSMVSEWGYDRQSETLEVTFNNGKQEGYPCSPEQWEEAKNADSAGKWMHENML